MVQRPKQARKQQAALEAALKIFKQPVDTSIIPTISKQDAIREADAVLVYHDTGGRGFVKLKCANCGQEFAFRHNSDSIKCCSVECMQQKLQKLGLKWDPDAPLDRRWGRYVPAIVPPVPLAILDENIQPEVQENLVPPAEPKAVASNLDDLFATLESL